MVIFEGQDLKETEKYTNSIGQCPVCGKSAELIGNTGVLRREHIKYTTICSNEYYRHVKTERDNDYCFKVDPPKKDFK